MNAVILPAMGTDNTATVLLQEWLSHEMIQMRISFAIMAEVMDCGFEVRSRTQIALLRSFSK